MTSQLERFPLLQIQIGELLLYLVLVKSDLGKDGNYFKRMGRGIYTNISFSTMVLERSELCEVNPSVGAYGLCII